MYLLRMPKADENMGEGTVARWLVAEGSSVAQGQDVVECVADKGEFLVPSEAAGVLRRIYAPERSVVPVGYILAAVGGADEPLPDVEAENSRLLAKAREELLGAGARAPAAARAAPADSGAPVRATPAARTLARRLGVRLADVERHLAESGVGGRIIREEDVREFAERERRAGP